MNKKILEKAKNILAERRKKAELTAKKNLQIALQHEKIATLYNIYIGEEINLAKAEAYNQPKDFKKLNETKKALIEELEKIDMNITDLRPNYQCPDCMDSGNLDGEYCACLKTLVGELLTKDNGISKFNSFKDANFAIFEKPTLIEQTYKTMEKWCSSNFKYNTVLIFGNTGVGKTFLIKAMARNLLDNGNYVFFSTAFNFSQKMLKYHTTFDETKDIYLEPFLDCDFLFIDDLGTEVLYNNVTLDYLYLIINERQLNNKPTVISTNLDLSELRDRYGERITSRLFNKNISMLLEIKNKDLRLKK